MKPVALLSLLAALSLSGPALAQSSGAAPSPAKVCADRWNEMKAKNQTGDQTYRDFAAKCLAGTGATTGATTATSPAAQTPAKPSASGAAPTGASAAAAQPSLKQCADRWNEMKAKNQTGKQTYRDFAAKCLAGTGLVEEKPHTSVPSAGTRTRSSAATEPDESDREALNRCNGQWQAYKAKNNLTGAKAWHVFMARCLP